jgi:hypothetical protein
VLGWDLDLDVGAAAGQTRAVELDFTVDDDAGAADVLQKECGEDVAEVFLPAGPPLGLGGGCVRAVPQGDDQAVGST